MKTKYILNLGLLVGFVFIAQSAKAQFIKIDDFTNSVLGQLSGQTSDGPNHNVWGHSTTTGAAGAVIITNSPTPGAGQPGSGTPLSPNALAAQTTSTDGAAAISLPVSVPTTSTQSTIFMQFDMGPNQTANNVNWDVANAPGTDAGGGGNMVELNANVVSSTSGRAGLTIRNNGNFEWLSADGHTIFNPLNSTIYNIWFVINNSAKTFVIYMQDASPSGTDLPSLTPMQVATSAAAPTEPGTPPTFSTNAIAFRNQTAASLAVFIFGLGGGGDTAQFVYDVYEDPSSMDLTNPVTGAAPLLLSPPVITAEPQPELLYAGATAVFTVAATGGTLHYQWKSNGVALTDGGSISGSASSVLTISNVSSAYALNYTCLITNANNGAYQSTNTTAVALEIVTPNGAFETALAAGGPLHFYAFDDTGSPSSGTEVAADYEGGDNGLYGANTQNGSTPIAGPQPATGFPGFSASNYAAQFSPFDEPSHVTVNSPWNLNTNAVTITAWIYPTSAQDPSEGIVFNRGSGSDVEGLNMSATLNSTLGYTWNNDTNTTGWDSGLQPPVNQWSFVALVVTPTNAIIDLMNTGGLLSSTHVFNHVVASFAGTTMIGDDSGTPSGARTFIGAIDEVAVYNQALTQTQLQGIFTNASGVAAYPPTNTVALLTPSPIYPGQSAQFSSIDGGSLPLTYTWQLNGVNLTDGANSVGLISGSATASLTISNLAAGDAGQSYNLTLVTSNASGSYTSGVPAVLTVSTTLGSNTIFTLGMEASGTDWNTSSYWSDGNPASLSAYSEPGSAYQVVPGTLERSPVSSNAVFPGVYFVIEGNGVLLDGGAASFPSNTTTGELRLKQSGNLAVTNFGTAYTDGGTVTFTDLQLNGGQIDNGTSSKVTLEGEMDVLTNSSVYADSAADGSIRTIQINSFLTGTGTLTYAYLSTAYTSNDLIISGTSNTFSGPWIVGQGALLGNAPNSLGTNSITVSNNAALETTYNLNNPHGNLILNGRMYLYTADTFNGVTINGTNLVAGTYTFAQLNSAYPVNFPSTWPVQVGSTTGTNTGTGSITVRTTLIPQITQQPTPASLSLYPGQTAQFTVIASSATSYQWWFTNLSNVGIQLSDGSGILGSKSNVLTIASVSAGSAGTYSVVVTNPAGSVTSSTATLTILTPGSATLITMSVVETSGEDWNTGANWSDGNPASLSAYSEPGSTYEVLSGAVLRTPVSPASTAFPGNPLVITNGGELLLEHSGTTSIAFPDLQLNGASLDNGANGLATLTGEIDIANSVTIFTDTNSPPGNVVNFDVPGGVGGVNYAALGAYADVAGHTYWNPITQSSGAGTTTAPATNSDGVTTNPITLTVNNNSYAEASTGYDPYDSYDNSAGAPLNTPEALEDNYLYIQNQSTPSIAAEYITNTLNNVPAGNYNLYLYGNNGGAAGGLSGYQNDWGTTFTVFSDVTSATTLSTANENASSTSNIFIPGADYVVFSNVVVGAGGTITFSFTANVNVTSPDYFGANSYAAFNGLQLVAVSPATNGLRSIEIDSLLTGNGTINYDSGDANLLNDLKIAGSANTFTGQWNVLRGTLLGGGMNSLGTNAITVSVGGALETAYNVNDTGAGLILNGEMFLHQGDTFQTVSVNGVSFSPGTYSFSQLNRSFPANFPATWPLQTGSTVNSGSGTLTVLSGPPPPPTKPAKIVSAALSGGTLRISGTNGAPLGTYHVLTSTNVALSLTVWTVITNGSFDGGGNFNATVPYSSSDKQRFYSIESP